MSDNLTQIINEIVIERAIQDGKWGGPAHDDAHTTQEFITFIHEHAEKTLAPNISEDKTCSRLIEVAALAVAAIESIRRKQQMATWKSNCD